MALAQVRDPLPLFAVVRRRLVSGIATLVLASVAIFAVLDMLPGSAAAILLGTAARPDTTQALEQQLGLDRPAPLRYVGWISGALVGDLGQSAAYGGPVRSLIAERLAVTLPLTGLAVALAVTVGAALGITAAGRAGGWPDRIIALVTQAGIAVPDFWFGLILILVFATGLHWLPAGGFPGWSEPWAAVRSLLLPALALALPQAAVSTRLTRAALLDVMDQDFIRTAAAKGASRSRVLLRHALPNALPPLLTSVGLQSSFLFAGAVLVETVFNLPGLGRLATQALAQRDLVVMRNVAMLLATLVISVNMIVDLAYAWVDPRLRAA